MDAHYPNPTGATDYVFPPQQVAATMEEDFARVRLDENGFNNIALRGQKEANGHLNADGHRLIAERLAETIDKLRATSTR